MIINQYMLNFGILDRSMKYIRIRMILVKLSPYFYKRFKELLLDDYKITRSIKHRDIQVIKELIDELKDKSSIQCEVKKIIDAYICKVYIPTSGFIIALFIEKDIVNDQNTIEAIFKLAILSKDYTIVNVILLTTRILQILFVLEWLSINKKYIDAKIYKHIMYEMCKLNEYCNSFDNLINQRKLV